MKNLTAVNYIFSETENRFFPTENIVPTGQVWYDAAKSYRAIAVARSFLSFSFFHFFPFFFVSRRRLVSRRNTFPRPLPPSHTRTTKSKMPTTADEKFRRNCPIFDFHKGTRRYFIFFSHEQLKRIERIFFHANNSSQNST